MPQHKGVEPYTWYWTIRYDVIKISGAIAANTAVRRPRQLIITSKSDADAVYQSLISSAKIAENYPAPGTILQPLQQKFFNRKSFAKIFIQSLIDNMNIGA